MHASPGGARPGATHALQDRLSPDEAWEDVSDIEVQSSDDDCAWDSAASFHRRMAGRT